MNPLFSFIVVNYRSVANFASWLESVPATGLTADRYEIIVVDNDRDERAQLERLRQRFVFRIVGDGTNLGFGRGINLAAREARGEILGLCNPDSRFLPGRLEEVAEYFHADGRRGIVGLGLVDTQGRPQAWAAGNEVTFWDLMTNNLGLPRSRSLWRSRSACEAAWVSGAAMFLPRALFEQLGGFDERFFLYFEDIDLCRRARTLGRTVAYYPTLSVEHQGGQSSVSLRVQKKEYFISQDKYFAKHRPAWEGRWVRRLRRFWYGR